MASTSDKDTILATGQPMNGWIHTVAALLAGVAIVSSAFHFWPFENSSAWQILCPANMAVLIWSVVLAGYILLKRGRWTGASLLPHMSVFAYLCINALSAAFAPDLSRTISF
ncbi:MAG: hypothetical protein NTX52_06305, partial [Planctomycetota bacterium]|nr:hypothetical protein [Planctomycetota bacterium]